MRYSLRTLLLIVLAIVALGLVLFFARYFASLILSAQTVLY